jgi:hypothetical protein
MNDAVRLRISSSFSSTGATAHDEPGPLLRLPSVGPDPMGHAVE